MVCYVGHMLWYHQENDCELSHKDDGDFIEPHNMNRASGVNHMTDCPIANKRPNRTTIVETPTVKIGDEGGCLKVIISIYMIRLHKKDIVNKQSIQILVTLFYITLAQGCDKLNIVFGWYYKENLFSV